MTRRKLLRKDVLKWIRNLKSGEYRKNVGSLVNSKGTAFCCLGVWADQHGCTWATQKNIPVLNVKVGFHYTPVAPDMDVPTKDQGLGYLQPPVAFGLTKLDQGKLSNLNDTRQSWGAVIDYIEKKILPRAKR